MVRGFSVFALWLALLAIGYDRFVKVGSVDTEQAAAPGGDRYRSTWEGGDGLPPTPAP